jgi:MFS family permease
LVPCKKCMPTPVKKATNIPDSLGLITGGSIADTLGWRWSQYIVAIIDGGVLVLLFVSFEEILFPRFLISDSTRNSSSLEIDSEGKTPTAANIVDVAIGDNLPKRTLVERFKPWSFYPEDRTTYWQYFCRPFFLLSFPNVIIVSKMVTSCAAVLIRLS